MGRNRALLFATGFGFGRFKRAFANVLGLAFSTGYFAWSLQQHPSGGRLAIVSFRSNTLAMFSSGP